MKIEIKRESNGIHSYLDIAIYSLEGEDVKIIKKFVRIVDEYNEKAIREA
jgi:hypothetical protein